MKGAIFSVLIILLAGDMWARDARWHPPLLPGRSQLRTPRSAQQRKFFLILTGHPNGWPGHIVDHAIALKHGGIDAWWNMQWQTIEEAKAKDRWE